MSYFYYNVIRSPNSTAEMPPCGGFTENRTIKDFTTIRFVLIFHIIQNKIICLMLRFKKGLTEICLIFIRRKLFKKLKLF